MSSNLPRVTLRIEQEYIDKLKYIAEKNERSLNQEITHVLKNHISQYEKNNNIINKDTNLLNTKIG